MKKETSKSFRERMLKLENPNLIVNIQNIKCIVDANPEIYDKDDIRRLDRIINHMAKDIYIDRTYVSFKGNRWKDSFIVEKRWYELMRLILKSNFGKNGGKMTNDIIMESMMIIAMTYLYKIAEKYGYDSEDIDITFKKNMRFNVSYEEDTRKSWNF